MCCFRTVYLLIIQIIFATSTHVVNKCCAVNEQLDSDLKSCISNHRSGDLKENYSQSDVNYLQVPNKALGLNGSVKYSTLSDTELDITARLKVDLEYNNSLHAFKKKLISELIDEKRECIDYHNKSRIHIYSVRLKELPKCCAKGERLIAKGDKCELIPGKVRQDLKQEIIYPVKNAEDFNPFPSAYSDFIIKVGYNFMNSSLVFKWNTVANVYEHALSRLFIAKFSKGPVIAIQKVNESFQVTNGMTYFFCYDAVSEGPLAPVALLAGVFDIYKCGRKDEQFTKDASVFTKRPGATAVSQNLRFDTVDWRESPKDAFWLPKKFHRQKMGVRFVRLLDIQGKPLVAVFDEDVWTLGNSVWHFPYVTLSLPLLSGETLNYKSSDFCFDFVDNVGRVLLVVDQFLQDYAVKCCYPGEIISPKGYCVKHNGSDWTLGSSEVKDRFDPTITPASNVKLPTKTNCARFSTLPINSSEAIQNFSGKYTTHKDRWKTVFYCNDFQMTHDGQQEEVVGRCIDNPSAEVFEIVLPLKVVSAILLAGAGMAAVLQEDTRRSAHGRALACHALCLAAANALQVTWAFRSSQRFDTSCDNYLYSVYFFMMAGNFWLTSITVNMAKGFRQPLGAMANAARQKDDAVVWKHFGLMSVFAWGGSIVLTIFALTMHRHRKQIEKLGFIAPSFFETRTCAREYPYYAMYGDKTSAGDRLGALFYYYVPMVLLVAANAVCVILTARIINSLQRDKAFLKRDTTDQKGCIPHGVHENALLYAKLLFTAGVAEVALEAVAWGMGAPQQTEQFRVDFYHSFEKYYIFHIITIFLDLARAVTVFWLCSGRLFLGIGVNLKKIGDRVSSAWQINETTRNSPSTENELK